jgi:hypothetical protein
LRREGGRDGVQKLRIHREYGIGVKGRIQRCTGCSQPLARAGQFLTGDEAKG